MGTELGNDRWVLSEGDLRLGLTCDSCIMILKKILTQCWEMRLVSVKLTEDLGFVKLVPDSLGELTGFFKSLKVMQL